MLKNQFLIKAILQRNTVPSFSKYPFDLPIVKNFRTIYFHPKVTYIIGENGSGKSTLLEGLAIALGFNAEGGSKNFRFYSRQTHSMLWEYIKVARGTKRPKDGYFFRAESFYNLATEIDHLDSSVFGKKIKDSYGGKSLHEQSHGESFCSLFYERFGGNGLYILDEPEAALSPRRQLELLLRIHQLLMKNSQFIIATHSPILMAYPDSKILKIDEKKFVEAQYEETHHYQLTKLFLEDHKHMLKMLFDS